MRLFGGRVLVFLVGLWLAVGVFGAEGGAASGKVPWRLPRWTVVARGLDLREALNAFAVAEGLSVVMSPEVRGTLSGDFRDVEAGAFLDRLATQHHLTWYYDGAALYVYGAGEIQTILANLSYMTADEVHRMLVDLGVEDERFPIKTTSNGELIMVSGPPRYVALISEMIQRADRLREERTFTEVVTRIFPLEHTWADNVAFSVSGGPESQVSIRGVAQLLEDIMGAELTGGAVEAGEGKAAAGEKGKAEEKGRQPGPAFRPVIRAENRLNAVVVRDVATRMPLYEQLIKELDVPQRLVEIGVTVLEMTKEDALDWQLSLKVTGSHGDVTGGVGQAVGALTDVAGLSGRGLAGALTYLGKDVSVSASLSALREKGTARSISRSTILTMDNMAAQLTDRQSYHARVVGTEVATLEEVSAGTTLQVKPRVVKRSQPDAAHRVWLSLELEDGGFESITVDAMPMTRTSSVETSAVVTEGESILLGGYLRDIEEEAGWGIPYLRDIPLIGWLFGGVSMQKQTIQRMFILTPYVIELAGPDLVREQAGRQRDVTIEDVLADDAEQVDLERAYREVLREDLRERREAYQEERLRRVKAERELHKQVREDVLRDDRAVWDRNFEAREAGVAELRAEQEVVRTAREAPLEEMASPTPVEAAAPEEAPAEPVAPAPAVPAEAAEGGATVPRPAPVAAAALSVPVTEPEVVHPEPVEEAPRVVTPVVDDSLPGELLPEERLAMGVLLPEEMAQLVEAPQAVAEPEQEAEVAVAELHVAEAAVVEPKEAAEVGVAAGESYQGEAMGEAPAMPVEGVAAEPVEEVLPAEVEVPAEVVEAPAVPVPVVEPEPMAEPEVAPMVEASEPEAVEASAEAEGEAATEPAEAVDSDLEELEGLSEEERLIRRVLREEMRF